MFKYLIKCKKSIVDVRMVVVQPRHADINVAIFASFGFSDGRHIIN